MYSDNGVFFLEDGVKAYTTEEIKALDSIIKIVTGNTSDSSIVDCYLIEGEHVADDPEVNLMCCLKECLTNCSFFINDTMWRDLNMDGLLYEVPIEDIPLYLNKDKRSPEVVQEIVAKWRLSIGR